MVEAKVDVSADPAALARRVADWLVARIAAKSGRFALNLSGGSTPKRLYALLASDGFRDRVDWTRLHLFFGDERYVPWNDADSNHRMVDEAMLAHVPIPPENVHGVVTEGLSPEEAADALARDLKRFYGAETLDPARPLFDVTLLGLGPDGHTASLFPGTPALDERVRWAVPVIGEKPPPQRITMTYPVLDSSAAVAFLVAGTDKRAMVARILGGDRNLPAGRIAPVGETIWFLDAAAAGTAAA
mgnify:CR=1 FL=1